MRPFLTALREGLRLAESPNPKVPGLFKPGDEGDGSMISGLPRSSPNSRRAKKSRNGVSLTTSYQCSLLGVCGRSR